MNKEFIDTVRRAIDGQYHLAQDGKEWTLTENNSQTRIRVPTEDSIAFSLDHRDPRPLAFFSNQPPQDLAKMCDAILFCCHKDNIYLFIIEEKTANRVEETAANKEYYKKQLINGKLFCDWLIALCIQYKYKSPARNVTIIPLLIRKPRQKSPRKGETGHRNDDDSIKKREFSQFDEEGFEIRNRCDVFIVDLISRLGRA